MSHTEIQKGPLSEETIRTMAEKIKRGMPGVRVILFGSYAWGDPHLNSDVDLAVVVPSTADPAKHHDVAVEALHLSAHGPIPVDVLVYRESTLAELDIGSLAYEIRTKGVEL